MRYPFVIYLNKLPKQAASMPILFVVLVDKIWKHSIYRDSTVAHELVHVWQWVQATWIFSFIFGVLLMSIFGAETFKWAFIISPLMYYVCYYLIHDYRLSVEIEATVAEVKQMEKDFEERGLIELDIPGELERQSWALKDRKQYRFKDSYEVIEKMLIKAYMEK